MKEGCRRIVRSTLLDAETLLHEPENPPARAASPRKSHTQVTTRGRLLPQSHDEVVDLVVGQVVDHAVPQITVRHGSGRRRELVPLEKSQLSQRYLAVGLIPAGKVKLKRWPRYRCHLTRPFNIIA